MTTTPTLSRATAGPSSAVAVASPDAPASGGVDLPPDPSRDYFPGLTAAPIDFVLLDLNEIFTRPSDDALTAVALVAARAFTLEGA